MNVAGLIYLLLAHYFSGKGFLRLFKLQLKPIETFCLSVIVGVPILSFGPCVLQLCHIPITQGSVIAVVAAFTFVFSLPLLLPFKRPTFAKFKKPQLYEWPFLIVCLVLSVLSVWRCYYYPPYARDMFTGPELIAEYTVREHSMINSVFNIDIDKASTSNIFKSPYITSLQIMYKLLVQPFGQLWMSVLFVPLMIWFYDLLHERINGFIASFLLMFILISPELYAYTYLMLYDMSNVIFFFIGFFFLIRYLDNFKLNYLAWVSVSFGLATYIRVETLMLVLMVVPLLLFYYYRARMKLTKAAIGTVIFVAGSMFFYVLCTKVFVKHFIPFKFDAGTTLTSNIFDISPFFQRMGDILTKLVFYKMGYLYYGYFFVAFALLLAADLVWPRKFNKEAIICLYGIAVVYVGFGLMGYLFPFITLQNTTKRGLFKAMPLVMLYMANSGLLLRLSNFLTNWEAGTPTVKIKPAAKPKAVAQPVKAQPARQPQKPQARPNPKKR